MHALILISISIMIFIILRYNMYRLHIKDLSSLLEDNHMYVCKRYSLNQLRIDEYILTYDINRSTKTNVMHWYIHDCVTGINHMVTDKQCIIDKLNIKEA